MGFQVTEAGDGVAGLATLAECRFDLVILDVNMPNMDGPTMLAKMRRHLGSRVGEQAVAASAKRPPVRSCTRTHSAPLFTSWKRSGPPS